MTATAPTGISTALSPRPVSGSGSTGHPELARSVATGFMTALAGGVTAAGLVTGAGTGVLAACVSLVGVAVFGDVAALAGMACSAGLAKALDGVLADALRDSSPLLPADAAAVAAAAGASAG